MKEEFVVRTTNVNDALAVEELLGASYPKLLASAYDPAVLKPALALITRANPALLTSGSYYLAETPKGEVVGCGGWTRDCPQGTSSSSSSRGHLRHFATHPEWLGRGVGRAIYNSCITAALAGGVTEFEVLSSLNAERFYSALGFKKVRSVELCLGSGHEFPSVLMCRGI